MLKRLFTAIIVFPISFIIVGLLTLMLIDMAGKFFGGTSYSFSNLTGNREVLSHAVTGLILIVHSALHLSFKGVTAGQGFAGIFALVGAFVFSVSCLSEHFHVMLLYYRRAVTMPLVFGCAFLIFGTLFNLALNYIGETFELAGSSPEQKATAVAQYHTDYDGTMNLIVLGAAILAAGYLAIRLTRWDGLPWCQAPLPVRVPHRSRNAL